MFTIKVALIGLSLAAALSTAAQAYSEQFGNGGSWVTIPNSASDGSTGPTQSVYHPGLLGVAGAAKAYAPVSSSGGRHSRVKPSNSIR